MPVMIATFGKPEDITDAGLDGKVFRYPVTKLIDRDDIGTSREFSKTKALRVTVKISGTLRAKWPANEQDLIKVMFQVAKEHLINELSSSAWKGDDLEVITKGACVYDPKLIEEPAGGIVEFVGRRPIGFV